MSKKQNNITDDIYLKNHLGFKKKKSKDIKSIVLFLLLNISAIIISALVFLVVTNNIPNIVTNNIFNAKIKISDGNKNNNENRNRFHYYTASNNETSGNVENTSFDYNTTTYSDIYKEDYINEDIQKLINEKKLKCFLGQNYLEGLKSFDIIFRSPSLLPSNPYLKEEESRGCYITTEVEEVIKYAPCKVIGITGSKGKTTTTTIVSKILENLGYNVYVGGNIGTPLFTKIEQLKETDIVVLELSSFQLMGMRTSPNIAVVTNISPDHLDIHGSYEEYINAKKYIFKNAKKNSILVLNSEDEIVKNFAHEFEGEVRYFGTNSNLDTYYLKENKIWNKEKEIIDTTKLILKGEHNYINICAALSAIKDFIKDTSNLEAILKNIPSVPHRLEFVREIDGVKWYNDSASTTPDKCLGGLSAFSEKIVLIAGGSDKNIPYTPLAKPVTEKVSKLILFGQTKNKIYDAVMEEVKKTNNRSL